jgi:predicted DNA-binding protein
MMSEEMIARLDAESKRTGASKSEIVRRAVEDYLKQREPSLKERPRELVQAVR